MSWWWTNGACLSEDSSTSEDSWDVSSIWMSNLFDRIVICTLIVDLEDDSTVLHSISLCKTAQQPSWRQFPSRGPTASSLASLHQNHPVIFVELRVEVSRLGGGFIFFNSPLFWEMIQLFFIWVGNHHPIDWMFSFFVKGKLVLFLLNGLQEKEEDLKTPTRKSLSPNRTTHLNG